MISTQLDAAPAHDGLRAPPRDTSRLVETLSLPQRKQKKVIEQDFNVHWNEWDFKEEMARQGVTDELEQEQRWRLARAGQYGPYWPSNARDEPTVVKRDMLRTGVELETVTTEDLGMVEAQAVESAPMLPNGYIDTDYTLMEEEAEEVGMCAEDPYLDEPAQDFDGIGAEDGYTYGEFDGEPLDEYDEEDEFPTVNDMQRVFSRDSDMHSPSPAPSSRPVSHPPSVVGRTLPLTFSAGYASQQHAIE